jgi:hypothetical protein
MTAREQHNARKGRTSSWIRRAKRVAIYLRDRFRCAYCGCNLRGALPHEMGLDHLIPQAHCPTGLLPSGLSLHHESNLVTACRTCNSSRRDTPWATFARFMDGEEAVRRILNSRKRKLNIVLAQAIIDGTTTWRDN